MKPEPLNDKGFGVVDKLNEKELLIDKSKNNLFHRKDIKSAVGWLKNEVGKLINEDKIRVKGYWLDVTIDKAFEDVTKSK